MAMTWGKRRAIVIVALLLVFGLFIWALASRPEHLAEKSVLVIDAGGAIEEQRSADLLSALNGGQAPVLRDYVDSIDRAAGDARITGLVLRISPLETGWAKLEEMRAHLLRFRLSGKPSICYLGYDGISNPEYYLASSCDQVWLLPTAPVSIHGMMAQALFLRGSLDKLKVVPEFYHIAEFKTAGNTFTEKKFTPAHREEVESLLHSIYDRYLTETASARDLDRAKFEALVEQGPLSSNDALAGHLVDRLAYWDQVQDYFRQRDGDWRPVQLSRYRLLDGSGSALGGGPQIAVVRASGLIVSGDSESTEGGGSVMGGDSVARDLRNARNDSNIRAIVLRVDSGGGSAVASEVIRREVELANRQKPVIVSMSDVAASGGYWIAMSARRIVADPDTITGSIGVLIGKFNLSGLYSLLGMSTDSVTTSENSTFFSDQQNFTPAQRAAVEKSLQETYQNFTQGVARGRNMKVEDVDKIAKGRVWSGAQAKDLGLVDELGGLTAAIAAAKRLAHIAPDQSVRIVNYPIEKTFFELLLERERDQMALAPSSPLSLDETLQHLASTMDPVQARMPFELHLK